MSGISKPLPVLACAAALAVPLCHAHAQSGQASPRIAIADTLSIQSDGAFEETAAQASVRIGAVAIRGNQAIDDARYQAVVENFFGEPLTEDTLEKLADELAQLAREAGYEYVRTSVDSAAAAMGIVAVEIDEGRIDAIRIEGTDNFFARRMLEQLVGSPARKDRLESVLLRVSDIPGVAVDGARLSRDEGANVLVVKLDKRQNEGRIAVDNYGSESFGPIRADASTRFFGVLNPSDEVRTSLRINPFEPDELLFASGSYQTQLTRGGTTARLIAAVGRTAPGGELGSSDISGDTTRLGATITAPLKRSKKASAWVDVDAGYITIQQDDVLGLLRDDTVVTVAVGLRTRFALAGGGLLRAGAAVERGLGILGATRLGDPWASRSDGDGVYTKFRFDTDLRIPIVDQFEAYFALAGQLADRPLLGSEELGLGGPYRVRGYDFAEVLGDQGVYGLAELRYRVDTGKLPLDYLQLYGFVDGGSVSDIDQTGGEGSLFSAGPGLRARMGAVDFEVESAFPLGGTGERSDPDGPQINVRAGVNF